MNQPLHQDRLSYWLEMAGRIGRLIMVVAPIAYGIVQYEVANQKKLTDIQFGITSLATQVTTQNAQTNQRIDALNTRVSALETHRESDMHDTANMAAQIAGMKAQGDETLQGVNELRTWFINHHKG